MLVRTFLVAAALGLLPAVAAAQAEKPAKFKVDRVFVNPPTLPKSLPGYSQAVAVRGGRTVYVSGQVSADGQGQLTNRGDLEAQLKQAFQNLTAALAAAGATTDDIVKMTYYVVNYKPEQLPVIRQVRNQFLTLPERRPASTLVGVQSLFEEGVLVEIEAVAVAE